VYGFVLPEKQYDTLKREQGWFDETPLERLADIVIAGLRVELSELDNARIAVDSENCDLRDRIDDLEQEARDRDDDERESERVEELENEIDFLKTLVADMEEELAALDVAV
jgi:predicted  nucleic acid-binding Zn-ribbon protein